MSPLDLRARRKALGIDVAEVAYAARLLPREVIAPSLEAALRIDAALTILETGGCVEVARAASMPRSNPEVVPRETGPRPPPWPEHSGVENLSGQCFEDVATPDGGGRLPMRPATRLMRNSALGD